MTMAEHKRNSSVAREDERAKHMYNQCKEYMNYHVLVETKDGKKFDAILMDVKKDKVEMLVPEMMEPESYGQMEDRTYRQPRFRRFGGLLLPLAALTALSLVPYYQPYPYYPYPYY
jgi:hypothetical protein